MVKLVAGSWSHLEVSWVTYNSTTVATQATRRPAGSIFVPTNHLGRGIKCHRWAGLGLGRDITRPGKMLPLLRYRVQNPARRRRCRPLAPLRPDAPRPKRQRTICSDASLGRSRCCFSIRATVLHSSQIASQVLDPKVAPIYPEMQSLEVEIRVGPSQDPLGSYF